MSDEWVELYYDPTIPAILTNDGRKVRYVAQVTTTQTRSAKPGISSGTISMVRLPIVTMGAYQQLLNDAQDRVETYLGKPEEPADDEEETGPRAP